ncbi:MAG: FAD-dependent oxidoreductase [Saprospiraceae bacterium]
MAENKNFIVLGGGFAGVEAAIKLCRYGYDVTLVSNRDYLFVYPISIWIPVKKKKFEDVQIPLKKLANVHGFKLIIDNVIKINHSNQTVELSNQTLEYDYLFIAMGMHKVYTKGLEHTFSICGNPEESLVIEEKLDKLVKVGHGKISIGFGGNPKDKTATAVRGGPAFEIIFNISNYLNSKKILNKFELTFFAPMASPGKRMGEDALKKMPSFFKKYKVKTHFGKKISEFQQDKIFFEDGSTIESDLTIYISGGAGHKVISESGLPVNEAGFIKIDEQCRVENHQNIFAIGDIASLPTFDWSAKQGHLAEVMADVSTYNVNNEIKGKSERKSYWDKLSVICLMDSGNGGALIKRDDKSNFLLPLPIVGHWLKKAWGFYYINSKLGKFPNIF